LGQYRRPGTRARAPTVLPSVDLKRVGTRDATSFAAQWLACALPLPTLRRHPRGCQRTAWGRGGFATSSSWRTCPPYSLPVSRRTQIKCKLLHVSLLTTSLPG